MTPIVRQFKYGQHTVTLETGAIARQATAAVMASMDDTTVFVTVVAKKEVKEGQDFFPLTVDYQERTYAAGRIPGGFFKREGRPSEGETLVARLIDRPVRPLFPEGFFNEIQVIATVVSVNPQISPDLVAMIGASAALSLSGVPFNGPIGAARVGFINDQFVLNPTTSEQKLSRLDLVVAGTDKAVLMVESEADILTEEQMLSAVVFGHQQQQVVIENIKEFIKEAGKPRWDWVAPEPNTDLINKVKALAESRIGDAYRITEKQARYEQIDTIKAEVIATLTGEKSDRFLFHYNFPPYSVGETGRIGSPKRREIGHGRLAKRGVLAVMPSAEEFPYVVRVVSEITESNGSSSMASVCGASLALMDAGVPIKAAVAGIAMGLVKEEEKFVVLSDILGDEDHLGDMDFKVAGTREGVTALQMDIKIEGITPEIMQIALNQAKGARMHILNVMEQAIPAPRADISDYAPRIHTMKIDPKKIKDVIGKGGATIRALTEETGTSIDIDDDGTVKIAATDNNAAKTVMARIEEIVAEVEVNAIYKGKVTRVVDFGAFVSILGGKEGLVHISQITDERVERVADYLSVGQEVMVKVVEIDRQNRIRLTMKDVNNVEAEVATPVEEQAE